MSILRGGQKAQAMLFSIEDDDCGAPQEKREEKMKCNSFKAESSRKGEAGKKQFKKALQVLDLNPLRQKQTSFRNLKKKKIDSVSEEEIKYVDFLRARGKKNKPLEVLLKDLQQLRLCESPLPAWIFPEAFQSRSFFYKLHSPLVNICVELLTATFHLVDDMKNPSLRGAELELFPRTYIEGGQFEMWFTFQELYAGNDQQDRRSSLLKASSVHLQNSSCEEESELDDPGSNSSDSVHSQPTPTKNSGKKYNQISQDEPYSSLELSPISNSDSFNSQSPPEDEEQGIYGTHSKKKKKKKQRRQKNMSCRAVFEKAQTLYSKNATLIRYHMLTYPLFRKLFQQTFELHGWKVEFEKMSKPCHFSTTTKTQTCTQIENAWPQPKTYLLCHHEKPVSTSFSSFSSVKAHTVEFLKMTITPL